MNGRLPRTILLLGLCFAACDEPEAAFAPNPAARFKIAYLSYVGSPAADQIREVLPEADGSVWIAGQAGGPGFPTTAGVFQPRYRGEDTARKAVTGNYGGDCWLGRLERDGAKFRAASYFGGSKQERNVYGLARTKDGDLVIATMTRSEDVPTTPGAAQPKFGGGPGDWCVARFAPDLKTLRWCTYIGGSDSDFPRAGLALDAEDRPVVVGYTKSRDFPTTPGAFAESPLGGDDVAVVKLSADGTKILAATRVGGSRDDEVAGVVVCADGTVWFGGQTASDDFPSSSDGPGPKRGGAYDATIVRLSADLAKVESGNYLGGKEDEFSEHRLSIAPNGDLLLAGSTGSSDFPTTPGAWQTTFGGVNDGFLVRYSADLKRVVFSMCVGRGGDENLLMPTVGPDGTIWCVGFTSDPSFPTTKDALQPKYGGGKLDGLMLGFSADGARLVYASFFGGSDEDTLRSIAFGKDGDLWLVGTTRSDRLPVTPGAVQAKRAGDTDGFVLKLR